QKKACLLPGSISLIKSNYGGGQTLAVRVQQAIVVVPDDLIADEGHNAPSLLQKLFERCDLWLTELADVAKDDHIVFGQLAMPHLRIGDDLDLDRVWLTWRFFPCREGLGQIVGLSLIGL